MAHRGLYLFGLLPKTPYDRIKIVLTDPSAFDFPNTSFEEQRVKQYPTTAPPELSERSIVMAEHPDGAILQRDKKSYAIVPRTPVGLVSVEDLEAIVKVVKKYRIPATYGPVY